MFLFYCLLFRSPITDLDWKGTGFPQNERKKAIKIAFDSNHDTLKTVSQIFDNCVCCFQNEQVKLEEITNGHLKWKNVDYSKTKKEIIIRRKPIKIVTNKLKC